MPNDTAKKPSRIQLKNRKLILEAALEVFSTHGFRGATLDQIAEAAGLSKPNILYYFDGKEDIHSTLLNGLLEIWLAPLVEIDPDGEPLDELMTYIHRKLEMSWDMPRESRLFAGEVIQGAPRMGDAMSKDLRALVDEKAAVIRSWIAQGSIREVDPHHLFFSIWALTQHYADFEVQVKAVLGRPDPDRAAARAHLEAMFSRLLKVEPM